MKTRNELGVGDRVGELDQKVLNVLEAASIPIMSAADISRHLFGSLIIDSQRKEYRRVLRALDRLYMQDKVGCYSHSQRVPQLWWSKARFIPVKAAK